MEHIKDVLIIICYVIILLLACVGLYSLLNKATSPTSLPVEEIHHIDSIVATNDSIKIVVNNLDSIKNAKIIEVKNLNNDSTLLLFYELLSK